MKKLLSFGSTAILYLATTTPALAAIDFGVKKTDNTIDPATSPGAVITFVIAFIIVLAVLAALFFIVLGAFQWITSGGDKTKVDAARNHIIAAIIGLVVIALSFVIMNVVTTALGLGPITGLKMQTLPCIATGTGC